MVLRFNLNALLCTRVTEEWVSVHPAYIMEKITFIENSGHGARTVQRSEVTLV